MGTLLKTHTENDIQKKKSKLWPIALGILISLAIGAFTVNMFYKTTVNILIMGIDGARTDTMIFASVNTQTNNIKTISIPRDTYFPTEGKNGLGQKKINAIYGFKEGGGAKGVKNAVERLLGVRIHHTILVDYEAVKSMVDVIGGVEVDVPFKMQYKDTYATPPLFIDLEPGLQVLKGDDAIGYLRFRKSSDGKIREGDVQRIERQKDFVKNAFEQAKSPLLPYYVLRGYHSIETDLPLTKAVAMSLALVGFDAEHFESATLPMAKTGSGSDGLSYFFHDDASTKALLTQWGLIQ